jgi:hypothetical protein
MIEGAWGASVTSTILSSNASSILPRTLMSIAFPMRLLMLPAWALTNPHSTIFLPYRKGPPDRLLRKSRRTHGSSDRSHVLPSMSSLSYPCDPGFAPDPPSPVRPPQTQHELYSFRGRKSKKLSTRMSSSSGGAAEG